MEWEEQSSEVNDWLKGFTQDTLIGIVAVLPILFIVLAVVHGVLVRPWSQEWEVNNLTPVVALASSLITLIIARWSAKTSVAGVVEIINKRVEARTRISIAEQLEGDKPIY